MDSFPNLPEQVGDYVARPEGMKYPRRGACVITTLYQSANIAAYQDYCATEICTEIPGYPTSPIRSHPCSKRSADRDDDDSEGYEGSHGIKRRGSVDR